MDRQIPVIIPAYEPDEKLIKLLDELCAEGVAPVIVVNDGSDEASFGHIYDAARERGAIVLDHAVNMGKGRALKTAFNYCLGSYKDLIGVVTADSDGQHAVSDIKKCIEALSEDPKALVLGVRILISRGSLPDLFLETSSPARS